MVSAQIAERRAISASSSQSHPPRRPHSCPSRLFLAECRQERLCTVLSDSRWLKVVLPARLDLEDRCRRRAAGHRPTQDLRVRRVSPVNQDSHLRGTLATRPGAHITRHPPRKTTAGDDLTRKITTPVCHPRMCTASTTRVGGRLHLQARVERLRSLSTTTRRTRASSPVIGPAPRAAIARIPLSRVETAR